MLNYKSAQIGFYQISQVFGVIAKRVLMYILWVRVRVSTLAPVGLYL